jgi:hypothetical protein
MIIIPMEALPFMPTSIQEKPSVGEHEARSVDYRTGLGWGVLVNDAS